MHSASKFVPAKIILGTALISLLSTQLSACFPVVAAGAATGGVVAADRRTSGTFLEDQNIELKAFRLMESSLGVDAHTSATSFNRSVLITGQVPDEATKAKATSLVKSIENVQNVTNELTVGPKTDLSTRSNDTYLTSKVKSKFITENKFPANYVKVITENGVVYLMGFVSTQEADDAVEIARNTDGVEKVVKVFEYTK